MQSSRNFYAFNKYVNQFLIINLFEKLVLTPNLYTEFIKGSCNSFWIVCSYWIFHISLFSCNRNNSWNGSWCGSWCCGSWVSAVTCIRQCWLFSLVMHSDMAIKWNIFWVCNLKYCNVKICQIDHFHIEKRIVWINTILVVNNKIFPSTMDLAFIQRETKKNILQLYSYKKNQL